LVQARRPLRLGSKVAAATNLPQTLSAGL
jgi:hypothetical protein